MEYATREQAQQAVTQLSNQNLMGRLVYVREVGDPAPSSKLTHANIGFRIVRLSLALLELPAVVPAAAAVAVSAAACKVASTKASAAVLQVAVLAVARFTSRTFVTMLTLLKNAIVLTILLASLQHWMARLEGPLPAS